MTETPAQLGGGLKTIKRALHVLETVASAQIPPTTRDVAVALGHNLSSTYNIVNTLVGTGYLSKENNGALRVGTKVALLYGALVRGSDFARMFRHHVDNVSAQSGETVYLSQKIANRVVIQLVREGSHSLRVTGLDVGYSGQEDRRASGKAIMAFLSPQENKAILRALHPEDSNAETDSRYGRLEPALDAVRTAGYAFDDEEFEPGICCVAVPYFNADGTVAGSLAASGPAVRVAALRSAVRDAVQQAAADISRTLNAPPSTQDTA